MSRCRYTLPALIVALVVAACGGNGPSDAELVDRSCAAFHDVLASDDLPNPDVVHEAGIDAIQADNAVLSGAWVMFENGLLLGDEDDVRAALDLLIEECGPPPEMEQEFDEFLEENPPTGSDG